MKIRLMPIGLALRIARTRREYLGFSVNVSQSLLLNQVPFKWFDEDCFLDVEDIDCFGHFVVLDIENGEEYSIPAWMVSDIVKGIQEEQ